MTWEILLVVGTRYLFGCAVEPFPSIEFKHKLPLFTLDRGKMIGGWWIAVCVRHFYGRETPSIMLEIIRFRHRVKLEPIILDGDGIDPVLLVLCAEFLGGFVDFATASFDFLPREDTHCAGDGGR